MARVVSYPHCLHASVTCMTSNSDILRVLFIALYVTTQNVGTDECEHTRYFRGVNRHWAITPYKERKTTAFFSENESKM